MKTSFGLLSVTLPYCYTRGPSIYYQRAVPGDLQERYGAKRIKVKLATSDIRSAAREVAALNRRFEAEWAALRAGPDATPKSVREQAAAIVGQWGLAPDSRGADEDAEGLFYDHLDRKRERFAEGDEEPYRDAEGSEYLNAAEIEAARMLAGVSKPRLSDALDLYLKVHQKRGNAKFTTFVKRSFGKLVTAVGDKAIENVERQDGHQFVSKMQAEGYATGFHPKGPQRPTLCHRDLLPEDEGQPKQPVLQNTNSRRRRGLGQGRALQRHRATKARQSLLSGRR